MKYNTYKKQLQGIKVTFSVVPDGTLFLNRCVEKVW